MLHRPIRLWNLTVVLLAVGGAAAPAAPSANRETPLVKAIRRVRPAVANIHSRKILPISNASSVIMNSLPLENKMKGMGSGVIVDERGYIVTNHHVVEDVTELRVTLVDGSTYPAEIVSRNPALDLALLKINPAAPLMVMPMGTSTDLMHGEPVIAIGNAFGYEHTITRGIISELHRDVKLNNTQSYRDLVQIDASINPGNSGGPLINADGEMIGLNVAIRAGAQGIGFAIPVDQVKEALVELMSCRRLRQAWHGLDCRNVMQANGRSAVIVDRIEPGSPADAAHIQPGDRLVQLADRPIEFAHDVERALLDRRPTDQIAVRLIRGTAEKSLTLALMMPTGDDSDGRDDVWQRLGIRLAEGPTASDVRPVSAQLRGGLRVLEIAPNSPASRASVTQGDILVGLDRWETLTVENVRYVLRQRIDSNSLRFYIIRAGQLHRGSLTLSDP